MPLIPALIGHLSFTERRYMQHFWPSVGACNEDIIGTPSLPRKDLSVSRDPSSAIIAGVLGYCDGGEKSQLAFCLYFSDGWDANGTWMVDDGCSILFQISLGQVIFFIALVCNFIAYIYIDVYTYICTHIYVCQQISSVEFYVYTVYMIYI